MHALELRQYKNNQTDAKIRHVLKFSSRIYPQRKTPAISKQSNFLHPSSSSFIVFALVICKTGFFCLLYYSFTITMVFICGYSDQNRRQGPLCLLHEIFPVKSACLRNSVNFDALVSIGYNLNFKGQRFGPGLTAAVGGQKWRWGCNYGLQHQRQNCGFEKSP